MSRNFSKEVDDYVKNSPKDKADAIIDWTQSTLGLMTKNVILKIGALIDITKKTINVIEVVILDITPLEKELMALPEFEELAQLVLICNRLDNPYSLYAHGTMCNCLDKNHGGCRCAAEIYKEAYDAAQERYSDYKEGHEKYLKAVYDYLYSKYLTPIRDEWSININAEYHQVTLAASAAREKANKELSGQELIDTLSAINLTEAEETEKLESERKVYGQLLKKLEGDFDKLYNSIITSPDFSADLQPDYPADQFLKPQPCGCSDDDKPSTNPDQVPFLQEFIYSASPIILDLDGDGVETVGMADGVHFDHDGNRFAEKSGWVGSDDGLLVWDRNGSGRIDGGNELFGNQYILADGRRAANGFEALAEFDSNGDGVVDQNDERWSELRVWRDANGNGVADDGELLTLEQAGVAGLNLEYANQNQTGANGNAHKQKGSFTRTDGATGQMTDVWFQSHLADTRYLDEIEVSDEIRGLPNLRGYGIVPSLHNYLRINSGCRIW